MADLIDNKKAILALSKVIKSLQGIIGEIEVIADEHCDDPEEYLSLHSVVLAIGSTNVTLARRIEYIHREIENGKKKENENL